MRSYNIFQAAALTLCLLAGLSGCGGKAVTAPEDLTNQPRAEAVTPAGDGSANAAFEAAKGVGEPGSDIKSGAVQAFPGQADLLPTIKAVTDFCGRPGSLAFMTRDGCRAALARLEQMVSGRMYFNSLEECRNFLQERRNSRYDIMAEHRAWCQNNFSNLHDRKGCMDAAPVFLGSFTEQGFCRNTPDPSAKKTQNPQYREAPYIGGYSEPGQKFDQPKTGPAPKPAPKPAPAPKPVVKPTPAPKAQPVAATPPAAPPVVPPVVPPATPDKAAAAAPEPSASGPVPPVQSAPPAFEPAPASAEPLPAQAPAGVPAWPQAPDLSNTAAQPVPDEPIQDAPAPVIGNKEEITPLPPVPAIGRIAPPLMPGVPPDAAVSASTLPAPASSEPAPGLPAPGDPVNAFSGAIPNFTPPQAPEDAGTQPMPLSGTPAGQMSP